MPSLNKAILIGNLTADPELKQTQNGISTCTFSIGVSRRYKDASGSYPTDFINIRAWRQTAEFITKFFKKGRPICIVGSIQVSNYTDQQGNRRYFTEVVADEASFVESKSDSGNNTYQQTPAFAGTEGNKAFSPANEAAGNSNGQFSGDANTANANPAPAVTPKFEEVSGDDDLPF